MDLKEWAREQKAKRDLAREQFSKDSFKAKVGTQIIELLPTEPRHITGQYGEATILEIKGDGGKARTWLINDRSPLLRDIAEQVAKGVMKLKMTRTGAGKATRYEVEAA